MRRLILSIAALVLVVPLVVESGPELLRTARLALALRGKPWSERRQIVFGDYYAEAVAISRSLPANDAVALIPSRPQDRDVAMFSVYHFYPRPARVYFSVDEWQKASDRPQWVVFVDHGKLEV
ncbi:MAG TPA: hypothetical protein VHU41_00570, partial [Thermoanaerobaculia bacterium]|nr:hypothetical protein [Thermoanaerobaculia bacterium]